MNKKIILLMMFVVLSSFASSIDLLLQTYESDNLEILSIMPITKNNYYLSYYDNYTEDTGYMFRFKNNEDVLEIYPNNKIYTLIDYNIISDFNILQVLKDDEIISKHTLNFCNDNGICEPCKGPDCETQENELVCGDCEKSSQDLYCNIEQDGICDPDCVAYEYEQQGEYEECYEEKLMIISCSDYFGKTCAEDQVCNGTELAINETQELCCLGECVYSENINIFEKSCQDFSWYTCEENQMCDSDEIYLQHINQSCCTSPCISGEIDDLPDIPEPKRDYSDIIVVSILVLSLVALIIIIIKRKALKITIFILLIASAGFFIANIDFKPNQITGNVVSQTEQAKMICDAAEAYNIPSSYLLAIAYKESGINHFAADGSVKISGDCGVGITQQQYNTENCDALRSGNAKFICGTSKIDGRQLDATVLRDNVECGAIELIRKCNSLSCINNQKQYYCANADNPLPPKNVIYSDWDIAIRAYNGWGCMSYYYRDLWGASDQRYINLISRIQSYVEDFKAREKQFQGYCEGHTNEEIKQPTTQPTEEEKEERPTSAGEIEVPDDIAEGDQSGYYYINPSVTLNPILDLVKVSENLAYGNELVEYSSKCHKNGNTYSYCIKQKLDKDSKTSWVLDDVDEDNEVGFFRMHTGYDYYEEESGEEKPVLMKFALILNSAKAKQITKLEYDEEAGLPPKPVATEDENNKETDGDEEQQDKQPGESNLCEKDELTVVLFGDSITQMHYDYGNYLQYYFNNNFDQKTSVLITQGLGGMRVDNQKSIDMFNNEILPANPDIVLMWFGMNSLEDYPSVHQDTYQAMIEEMLKRGITPILLTTSPICSEYTSRDFSHLNNIVQIDKNLANYYDGVYLIDVREELNKLISSGCAEYFADGYHINSKGHDYFAQVVVKQFIEWKNNNQGPFNCQ